MDIKSLFASVALAVVGISAGAQEATTDTWTRVTPVKSVEQVRSELAQARKDGTIKFGSAGYMEKLASNKSRGEVREETIASRNSGELSAIGGEAHAFAPTRKTSTVLAGAR
jgi:hypothetical protein